jgi:para-aminobenzoate synthetase component 1
VNAPYLDEIEYPKDGRVPRLDGVAPYACLLESAPGARGGRWSFLLWNPARVIEWRPRTGWRSRVGPSAADVPADPWEGLEVALAAHAAAAPSLAVGSDAPPLRCGAAGWLAYELAATLETIPSLLRRAVSVPLARFAFSDAIVALDHERRRAWLSASGPHAGLRREEIGERWARALARTPELESAPLDLEPARTQDVEASLDPVTYAERFARVHELLRAGHIYQANLTVGFSSPTSLDAWAVHEVMRRANPVPYAAHLGGEETSVISASPELFLSRRGRTLVTRPIKGTRPRGRTPAADEANARALVASAKDRAEHVMIVDVHRNDLGRVAECGTVHVTEPWALETFPGVHHLTSTIVARERRGTRPLDALRAAFPAGSITGAPKIRAMEVLADLEPHARGVYTGALGWLDTSGDFEFAVAIRTLTVHPDRVEFPAGGGIVLDSECDAEYEEAWIKARILWAAVKHACDVSKAATATPVRGGS